jgi:hypothetical protein
MTEKNKNQTNRFERVGPGNRRLSTSEVLTYVTHRKAMGTD